MLVDHSKQVLKTLVLAMLILHLMASKRKSLNAAELAQRGFLVNAASEDVIRIAPAFIITEREIIKFAGAFADICDEIYDG